MSNYLLPVDDNFIEVIARAIAKNRMHRVASTELENEIGIDLESSEQLESHFESIFEDLWNADGTNDEKQKSEYRSDARAAVAAINLKLLVST